MKNLEEMITKPNVPIVARYWFGAMLGTLAGFIAGILLAPKPGLETRSDIQNTVNHASEEAQEKMGEIKETISARVSSAKECVSGAAENVKQDVQSALNQAKETGTEIKKDIKETMGSARI